MTSKTVELRSAVAAERPALRDVLARPGTRVVLLAGSEDPNAKMTVVLLDAYGPAFVVKVPTTRAAETVVRREGESLEALAALPLGSLGTSIPRRIGAMVYEGRTALVATALDGTPMTVAYHGWHHTGRRRTVRRDFAAAGAWLAELHTRTAGLHQPISLIDTALEGIGRRFPRHPDLAAARRALAAPAGRLGAQMTPRTVVHGDYWYGNLLVDRRRVVGVVDWESCELSGEPLRDVARFAVSYALYLDRHTKPGRPVAGHKGLRADSWGAGIAYALSGAGWFSAITQNYLMVTMGRLGVPGYLWRDVLLGGLADVAATADHAEFAEAHLSLLAGQAPRRPGVAYVPVPRSARRATPSTTEEPSFEEPSAEEPEGEGPEAEEPVAVEVDIEEPVVEEFVTEEPVAEEPGVAEESGAVEEPEDGPIRIVTVEMRSLYRSLAANADLDADWGTDPDAPAGVSRPGIGAEPEDDQLEPAGAVDRGPEIHPPAAEARRVHNRRKGRTMRKGGR